MSPDCLKQDSVYISLTKVKFYMGSRYKQYLTYKQQKELISIFAIANYLQQLKFSNRHYVSRPPTTPSILYIQMYSHVKS